MRLVYNIAGDDNPGRHLEFLAPPFDSTVPNVSGDQPYRPETVDQDDVKAQTVDAFTPA